jgi:hypothetical protein
MSEDEKRAGHEEEQDEVEAHRRNRLTANEEAGDETESDDEVEAHKHGGKMV